MLRRLLPLVFLPAVFWGSPLRSQSLDMVSQIQLAIDLPVAVAEARIEGFPGQEIVQILDILLGGDVPAGEAFEVINVERASRREHGRVDNFGAFVQSQLRAGLRGRDLAAAIKSEHAARGRGRGGGVAGGHGRNDGVGVMSREKGREAHGRKDGREQGHSRGSAEARDRTQNDRGKPAHRPGKPNR